MAKKQELIQFVLRISPELNDEIELVSQENGQTKAGWVRSQIIALIAAHKRAKVMDA